MTAHSRAAEVMMAALVKGLLPLSDPETERMEFFTKPVLTTGTASMSARSARPARWPELAAEPRTLGGEPHRYGFDDADKLRLGRAWRTEPAADNGLVPAEGAGQGRCTKTVGRREPFRRAPSSDQKYMALQR